MNQHTGKSGVGFAIKKPRRKRAAVGVPQILKARKTIIEALIEQAKKGSYLHAKFLFDYARISQAEDPEAANELSLAELLLEKLQSETDASANGEPAEPEKGAVL